MNKNAREMGVDITRTMGLDLKAPQSKFYTMIEDGRENVNIFDYVMKIITKTDLLKNDTADFMCEEPVLLTPVYKLCHEELLMLMWNTKYAESAFLPEKWRAVMVSRCNFCDTLGLQRSEDTFRHHEVHDYDDVNKLWLLVFDRSNYCEMCRHALYDIETCELV